jgi:hypothetical protein
VEDWLELWSPRAGVLVLESEAQGETTLPLASSSRPPSADVYSTSTSTSSTSTSTLRLSDPFLRFMVVLVVTVATLNKNKLELIITLLITV